MPSPDGTKSPEASDSMIAEAAVNSLVISTTKIPVPRVHAVEPHWSSVAKGPFMLMDCLQGNVGIDLGMRVPEDRKPSFFAELARIHVRRFSRQFNLEV
jgi:hypothetical protein